MYFFSNAFVIMVIKSQKVLEGLLERIRLHFVFCHTPIYLIIHKYIDNLSTTFYLSHSKPTFYIHFLINQSSILRL